jgi:hypothetical protein
VSAVTGPSHRRRWWILLLLAAAIPVVWMYLAQRERAALATALRRTRPGQVLDLARVVPGSWDHVLVAGPYESKDQIRQACGGRLPPELESLDNFGVSEGSNWLVFLQYADAGKALEVSRRDADFDGAQLMHQVPRTRARLARAASEVAFSWLKP